MHVSVPDSDRELQDQIDFDQAVAEKGKIVLEVFAGLGIVAALLMSIIALNQSGERNAVAMTSRTAAPAAAVVASGGGASQPAERVSLSVIPTVKPGPDGKKHDAMTQTDFTVKVGQKLELRINNTDQGEHSITSPQIGVNLIIKPGIHTYEVVVKEKGRFSWFCLIPCDSEANGWAMQHAGFMAGYITAT
jgi:hypothetical protein